MADQPLLPDWLRSWPVWVVLTLMLGLPTFRTVSELVKWVAGFGAGREDARARTKADAERQFELARASLMDQLRDDLAKARGTMDSYEAELAKLRRARALFADAMVELRTAALAARAMVHELEGRLGDPKTVFSPLPSIDEDGPMRN